MLPKSHRLPSSDISRVMKTGKRVHGDGFCIVYRKGGQETRNMRQDVQYTKYNLQDSTTPCSRFAFIVSKKTDKRATVRNRIKRILNESVRHLRSQLSEGIDAICIGNRGLSELTQAEVEVRVRDVLRKVMALNNESRIMNHE